MAKVNYIPQNWFDTNVPDTQSGYIIPGKLHPAYLGKLLDGSTSHSGSYGSIQSDGRKYYYTDIDGSRPIKDPRIGAHFGSQRYDLRSLQLLEQETATHGKNVYSVDGREYLRAVSSGTSITYGDWYILNDQRGNYIQNNVTPGAFIEIVAYGNQLNMSYIWTANASHSVNRFDVYVDGVLKHDSPAISSKSLATVDRPGLDRYVNGTSLLNLVDEADNISCGLHTFKMLVAPAHQGNPYSSVSNIEIITQDITSAATRSQIQIPEQDVFTHGKKVRISAHTEHYDPFNGFTSGSDISSYVDTTTSLGLSKWLHSGNYYRPYNGMRVVKWAGQTGIHTSVTVMPPNAKSTADSSTLTNATAKANASISNNTFYPTFEAHSTSVNEDRLHEVAKCYHWREFGNGSANGTTWKDLSMFHGNNQMLAYNMDDGLTSISYNRAYRSTETWLRPENSGNVEGAYTTFIGTGFTIKDHDGTSHTAQNLPYGTHIIHHRCPGDTSGEIYVDGIRIHDGTFNSMMIEDFIYFHQPKMPPIPDDACIIADYMLMADFVPQTSAGIDKISKGVRSVSASRDIFIDDTGSNSLALDLSTIHKSGFKISSGAVSDSDTTITFRLPSFGTNYVSRGYQHDTRKKLFLDTTDKDSASTKDNTAGEGSYAYLTSNLDLGVYKFGTNVVSGQYSIFEGFDIVTPIHTSHHYKTFETPFLQDLIGGDRNMEQTHLVCSPDGKTWDEITRDTSYIGNMCISTAHADGSSTSADTHPRLHTRWRGTEAKSSNWRIKTWFNKDFAIAYDRVICLKDGLYRFTYGLRMTTSVGSAGTYGIILNDAATINANVTGHIFWSYHGDEQDVLTLTGNYYLKRGDQISWQGPSVDLRGDVVQIERVKYR